MECATMKRSAGLPFPPANFAMTSTMAPMMTWGIAKEHRWEEFTTGAESSACRPRSRRQLRRLAPMQRRAARGRALKQMSAPTTFQLAW